MTRNDDADDPTNITWMEEIDKIDICYVRPGKIRSNIALRLECIEGANLRAWKTVYVLHSMANDAASRPSDCRT